VPALAPAEDLSLGVTGRFAAALGDAADNLVMRAARLLSLEAGLPAHRGAAIRLEKRLPVAAGLGGGSADAAAALHGLCALWDLSPGDDDLARMAISLGADVPVCLALRPAFVSGIGERLDPAPALPRLHVALVNSGAPLSTASVFAGMEINHTVRDGRFAEAPRDAAALADLLASRANDLEPPARELCPAVGDVISALGRQPDCLLARMSGSGATCFGLFDTAASAAAAARDIASRQPAWWAVSSPLLDDSDTVVISRIPAYM
ncbi:MAG: 4-(cytidine 5'-diphospho)-2-C-methyl-D-erythritol kinase, partial [Proteobacteria bacterium]|nr:4-(cytidine 5'-diphospho)-2-C-methyl-D-erythritol kinase [Pseudomonadota bacterium]